MDLDLKGIYQKILESHFWYTDREINWRFEEKNINCLWAHSNFFFFFLKHFMPICTVQFFDYLEPLNFLRLFSCYQVKIYFRSDFCMQHIAATYLYMNACLILNSYLQIEKVIFWIRLVSGITLNRPSTLADEVGFRKQRDLKVKKFANESREAAIREINA